MGKNVNDDWGERGFLWVAPESWVDNHDDTTPAPWHGGHGGGQLMLMGQYWLWWWGRLRMTRHVTWSHRDTSQRYRGERTDPGTIERPEVTRNIKQMYSQFTVTASCISQNVRKIKIATMIFHATCSLQRNIYTCKQNWWSIIFHIHVIDDEEYGLSSAFREKMLKNEYIFSWLVDQNTSVATLTYNKHVQFICF